MAKAPKKKSDGGEAVCASCHQPITDVVVNAMDQTWHQEHFVCAHCKKPITDQRYHVYENKPYCEADYTKLYLKRCSACGEPIHDVVVMALGKPWHKDHFKCATCGSVLSHKGYFEHDQKPHCQGCFQQNYCAKCKQCDKPITETAVIAVGEKYHPQCFKCSKCKEPVMDCTFKIVNGKQICSNCEAES